MVGVLCQYLLSNGIHSNGAARTFGACGLREVRDRLGSRGGGGDLESGGEPPQSTLIEGLRGDVVARLDGGRVAI